jgi:peptide/nickel transport system permease protein
LGEHGVDLMFKTITKNMKRHPQLAIGGLLVSLAIIMALFAPWISSQDPLKLNHRDRLRSPSRQHLMGTDEYGRDIFSRVLYGARISIIIGVAVVAITSILGTLIGLIAGYYRRADNIIMRILDGLMAFPGFILALTLTAVWGAGLLNIILALSLSYTPAVARVVRGSVLSVAKEEYVESARAAGARNRYLLFKTILPNCLSPLLVQAAFTFAVAVRAEAMLSFLGVGIRPPTPTWGGMVSEARAVLRVAEWCTIFPGLAIAMTVLGLNLFGDGLRDKLDPRLNY